MSEGASFLFATYCYIFEHVQCALIPFLAASTEQIDKAKEIIKKLTFKYQPDAFENPGVQ